MQIRIQLRANFFREPKAKAFFKQIMTKYTMREGIAQLSKNVQFWLFISIFLKDPQHFFTIWAPIRIEIFAWIRIRNKSMRIRNTGSDI
jgi:hypothetical protein